MPIQSFVSSLPHVSMASSSFPSSSSSSSSASSAPTSVDVIPPLELQPVQIQLQLGALEESEPLVLHHNADATVIARELAVAANAPDECP